MKATKYFAALVMAIIVASPTLCSAADYSFGGDTTATSGVQRSDSSYIVDTITSPANTGTLDSGIVWLDNNGTTPDTASIVIYANDSTFLDSTASFVVSGTGRTRFSAAFIEGAAIAASTKYHVGLHFASEGNGLTCKYHYNAAGATISSWYKNAQPTIPATITGPTKDTNNRDKAIWIYYSDAAATTVKKLGAAKLGAVKL